MLPVLLLAVALPACVPARWPTGDPASLSLLKDSPINCLLVESAQVSPAFAKAATHQHVSTLAVVRTSPDLLEAARQATAKGAQAIVLEGNLPAADTQRVKKALADSPTPVIELVPRSHLSLEEKTLLGTYQGVWPGIQVQDNGTAKAAPSGAPWIDTNTGFLRFVRAAVDAPVWIANTPPPKTVVSDERYLQAIADAAMVGARWVVALDPDLSGRLLKHDPAALKTWQRMNQHLRFYEDQAAYRTLPAAGQLAIVQDVDSGALLSGGILDMIAVKHTPMRPVANRRLQPAAIQGAEMAVDVAPTTLNDAQKAILKDFARRGGTLLNGPVNWQFPAPQDDQITLGEADTKKLDDIWHDVNVMTGRKNLGARLFNVASMLSHLTATPDGKQVVLQLVNYADYPVDSITVHFLGRHHRARLLMPGEPTRALALYDNDDGSGVEIDKIATVATLVLD